MSIYICRICGEKFNGFVAIPGGFCRDCVDCDSCIMKIAYFKPPECPAKDNKACDNFLPDGPTMQQITKFKARKDDPGK